jgi:LPXTG-site transpeptidase (sortase) family protein
MADTVVSRRNPADEDDPGAVAGITGPPPAPGRPAAEPPAPAQATATELPPDPVATALRGAVRGLGISLFLLATVVLGFAGYLYGLSGVQEGRSQQILYQRLKVEFASLTGPLGPTAPGAPVAVLDIPVIGVTDMVVVEGTSPENLTLGPGHLRDTPLPGQAGVSEVFGRRATFGAPFARLSRLRPGDVITAVTGQGWATYVVAALATSRQLIKDPAPDRLLLLTATSPVVPGQYLTVDAHLITLPHAGPGVAPVINSPELPLAGDRGALALTAVMEWGVALALVSAGATYAATRWPPWVCYLALAPVALVVLWNLYQSLAALLPNLY